MRWIFRILLLLLAVIVLIPAALLIALNTGAGRNFAAAQINHFAGGLVNVSGLGGHFPADIKLAHLEVADTNGTWLTGDNLELRWRPVALLSHRIHVTSLTAANISVARMPVPAKQTSQSGGSNIPNFQLDADRIAIPALNLGPALAGQPVTLAVTGNVHLQNLEQGNAVLDATAANGAGEYHLAAAFGAKTINTSLHIAEPPDGLLGHFAGPQIHAPLNIDLTLNGTRDNAALNFTAALGKAKLDGAGALGLNPNAPKADVVFTVPSLAPFAAIAKQNIAGSTTLHIIASQQNASASFALDGDVGILSGPGPVAKLVGLNGHISALVSVFNNITDIQSFNITGAGFNAAASGSVSPAGVNLNTHLALGDVGELSPGISGPMQEDGGIAGTFKDFAVNALITGNISEKSIPSGPFSITINAQHLPSLPTGTLTGSGALEASPLLLDAAFTRDAAGAMSVIINNALWRSLNAKANLALAPGEALPTGSANFAVKNLKDFAPFTPLPLTGSINGNFAHQAAEDFTLNLNANNVVVSPGFGAINGRLSATGPVTALAVKLNASIAKVLDAPAQITTSGIVNLNAQSVRLNTFTAAWKTINAKLLGPAAIQTKPGVRVQNLVLDVNGRRISLDGALTPKLNIKANVQNLAASLANLASPAINASGEISATASLVGTMAAPTGTITLDAHAIKLRSGPASSLPPANLTATATLAKQTANLNAKLGLGTYANLSAEGLVPLSATGPINLHLTGDTDLRLLDPILAAAGSTIRGVITPDLTITGTPKTPRANGSITLADGSVQNVSSGLNLTKITARITAVDRLVTLENLSATAGQGSITGHGTVDLGQTDLPVYLNLKADNATPVASDLVTENLNASLTLTGALRAAMKLAGDIEILNANINLPKSLPPAVANLPIINRGEAPPPPPPPPPNIALDLLLHAKDEIFVRGDGLFAELGGHVQVTGTAANPQPEGGFTLIRGYFSIGGKTLQFTKGVVSFTGDGFIPSLDLEATTVTTNNTTASLIIGGTADKPTITLSASPPLPSDEVLSQLLFGQATTNLSPFQAASLAAALASLSGIGGSAVSDPLGGVRNALGLDELSLGGSGSGPPSVQAGRYVAPGVYVGAQQSTSGQGTKATVEINLYKGLKLQTSTGTSGTGSGSSSSVGITYQFNY